MNKFRNKTIITLEFALVVIFHIIVLSSCMKSKNTDDVKVSEAVPIKIGNETETSVEESISEEPEITETLSYDSSNSQAEDESLMAILYDEPESKKPIETLVSSTDSKEKAYEEDTGKDYISEPITFNSAWEFGGSSKINTGTATLYYADGDNKRVNHFWCGVNT